MSSYTGSSPSRQILFFSTGSIAGVCSSSADYVFDRASSAVRGTAPRPFDVLIRSLLPHIVKPGIRFWGFDLAKSAIPPDLPVSLRGGLAGAAGGVLEMGFADICNQIKAESSGKSRSLTQSIRTTLLHAGKLFLCFGSYTYLANTFSKTLPPRPFRYCFSLGAIAGAFGTFVITPLEMYSASKVPLRIGQVLKTACIRAPRGAVSIGTVISVQVTSSAWLLGEL